MNNERAQWIERIRNLPAQIEQLVTGLTPAQLTTHFLVNEWTVAQNVHHLADSHMNSYIRCKLMATEDHPTLKPYDQDLWAAFPDAQKADISGSLAILKSLHERWVEFFEGLPAGAWSRTGFHPESGTIMIETQLSAYVEHGEAHVEQITRTLAAQ